MPFAEAWEIAKKIPGWYSEAEAHFLYVSALRASKGLGIIEVGCYAGRSTRILAEVARETGSILWVIDNFSHPNKLIENPEAFVQSVLMESKCSFAISKLSVAEMPNHALPSLVDFIHIDDSHEKTDLLIDQIKIIPRLRAKGLIAFHDYAPHFEEVMGFVDSLRPDFDEIGRADACIVLEKK
jgi:predicted O-methyltransferase YrrM